MRRPLLALTMAIAAVLAACSASTSPGWTYAAPTPTPAVTAAPSGAASAPPSAAASGGPASAAPSGGSAGGATIALAAAGIAYDQKELAAPADAPFVIAFSNTDAGIPHNVEIKDANNASVFKGEIFNGAAEKDYQVSALPAGAYTFVCSVHPNMTGTLKVGG